MNDVKELCDRMLDVPAPPRRDSAVVLAIARRSTRRRNQVRVLGSGLAVAATVAAAAALLQSARPGLAPAPVAPIAADTWVVQAPPRPVPPAQAAAVHSKRMEQLLLAAVPRGYGKRLEHGLGDETTVYPPTAERPPDGPVGLLAGGFVIVSADGGEGQLWAMITNNGKPAPTGDLCAPGQSEWLRPTGTCMVIVVDGVPIQVVTSWDAERGQEITATRFLRGGALSVISWQGIPVYEPDTRLPADARKKPGQVAHKPMLPAPMLTTEQVAALAGNPAMLQFP